MASFGYGVGDILTLTKLAWDVVQNTRKACGEHGELARETQSLHSILRRLQVETSNPESLLSSPERTEELDGIVSGCQDVLKKLNNIVLKYNALPSGKKKGLERFFQKVRFGNGEMVDLGSWRLKLATNTSAVSLFLNMITIGSLGRIEQQLTGDLKAIRFAVNEITANFLAADKEGSESSVFTAYRNDDRAVWKEFRRELVKDGFDSAVIAKHKHLIQAYVKELGDRGLLDEEIAAAKDVVQLTSSRPRDSQSPGPKMRDKADLKEAAVGDMRQSTVCALQEGEKSNVAEPTTKSTNITVGSGQTQSNNYQSVRPSPSRQAYVVQALDNPYLDEPGNRLRTWSDSIIVDWVEIPRKVYRSCTSLTSDHANLQFISDTRLSSGSAPTPEAHKSNSRPGADWSGSLVVDGMFLTYPSQRISVQEVRRRLTTYSAYDVRLLTGVAQLPLHVDEFLSNLTTDIDEFLKDGLSSKGLLLDLDAEDFIQDGEDHLLGSASWYQYCQIFDFNYWEQYRRRNKHPYENLGKSHTHTKTVVVSKVDSPIIFLNSSPSPDSALRKLERLPKSLQLHINRLIDRYNDIEKCTHYEFKLSNIAFHYQRGENSESTHLKIFIQRSPNETNHKALWKEYMKLSPSARSKSDTQFSKKVTSREILESDYLEGRYYPGLQLTTNLTPVQVNPGETQIPINRELVLFVESEGHEFWYKKELPAGRVPSQYWWASRESGRHRMTLY